ncbi:MAG: hypothetical protein LBU87_03465, partial [Lactobacillales bacterium]|nr:hypothetical protein [Lactobacillales bacterium]
QIKPGDDWERIKAYNAVDTFGESVIAYTEIWGKLIQHKTRAKSLTGDIVHDTMKTLGIDKLNSNTKAALVDLMVAYWKHGDELGKILGMTDSEINNITQATKQDMQEFGKTCRYKKGKK